MTLIHTILVRQHCDTHLEVECVAQKLHHILAHHVRVVESLDPLDEAACIPRGLLHREAEAEAQHQLALLLDVPARLGWLMNTIME